MAVCAAMCAMVLLAAGCTDDSPNEPLPNSPTTSVTPSVTPGATDVAVLQADRDVPVAPAATWTVLVYLNGRNDLDGRAAAALDQLAQLQPNPGSVNIVTLAGRTGASGRNGGGLQPFNSVKLLAVDGGGTLAELADFGPVAMGQPGALREFVANGVELFPSQRVALIVVGPGAGWQGMSTDTTASAVDQLSVPELADEISQGLSDRTHAPLDLVALDGNLMAGYEVASALTGSAAVLAAAEGASVNSIVDLAGLRAVAGTDVLDGRQLARALLSSPAAGTPSPAPSIIDLSRFGALRTAVDQWSVAAAALVDRQSQLFLRAASSPAPLAWSPGAGGDSGAVDLVELTSALANVSPELDALGANVVAELRAVVDRTAPDPLDATGGLSLYVPVRSPVVSSYSSMEPAGGWRAVVDALGRLTPSAPSFAADSTLSATPAPPPYLFSASLTTDSVPRAGVATALIGATTAAAGPTTSTTSTEVPVGSGASSGSTTTRDPIAFSVAVPATVDAAGVVRAQWDGRRLLAIVGTRQEPLWLDVAATRAGVVSVPFTGRDGRSEFPVVARARFDGSTNTTGAIDWFRIGARGDWSPILDPSTVTVTPLLRVEQVSGPPTWAESGAPFDAGNGVVFTLAALDTQASFGVRMSVGGRADATAAITSVVSAATVAAASASPAGADAASTTTSVSGDLSGQR